MATLTPERIDEEIEKQRALLLDLLGRKNSLSPVSRLPHETLANIFILGARDYYEGDTLTDFRVPCWVNVSYVCRHWRNVALNCPTLWSYHFTVSLRWTKELLARSKQASLRIRLSSKSRQQRADHWWLRHLGQLLHCMERIDELRLCLPSIAFSSNRSLCAPRLQVLDITQTGSYASRWSPTSIDGDTPCLHTLKLTGCPLRWGSLNLSALTTLFLCCVPVWSQKNVKDLLATLRRMQALTVLHLENALAAYGRISGEGFNVSQKIDLPRLARLFVVAPRSTVITLLSYMRIPLKTEVRLCFKLERGSSIADYAQISSILAQRFSKDLLPVGPAVRSLGIRFCLRKAKFALWASEQGDCRPFLSVKDPQWDSSIPLVVLVETGQLIILDRLWDRIISDICCSIPSMNVQTLHLVRPSNSLDFWREIFSHLGGLRCIKLSHGSMPDLASLLALTADEGTGHHDLIPNCTFVPALEGLELNHMTLVSHEWLLDPVSTRKTRPGLVVLNCDDGDELNTEDDDSDESSDSESDYSGSDSEESDDY